MSAIKIKTKSRVNAPKVYNNNDLKSLLPQKVSNSYNTNPQESNANIYDVGANGSRKAKQLENEYGVAKDLPTSKNSLPLGLEPPKGYTRQNKEIKEYSDNPYLKDIYKRDYDSHQSNPANNEDNRRKYTEDQYDNPNEISNYNEKYYYNEDHRTNKEFSNKNNYRGNNNSYDNYDDSNYRNERQYGNYSRPSSEKRYKSNIEEYNDSTKYKYENKYEENYRREEPNYPTERGFKKKDDLTIGKSEEEYKLEQQKKYVEQREALDNQIRSKSTAASGATKSDKGYLIYPNKMSDSEYEEYMHKQEINYWNKLAKQHIMKTGITAFDEFQVSDLLKNCSEFKAIYAKLENEYKHIQNGTDRTNDDREKINYIKENNVYQTNYNSKNKNDEIDQPYPMDNNRYSTRDGSRIRDIETRLSMFENLYGQEKKKTEKLNEELQDTKISFSELKQEYDNYIIISDEKMKEIKNENEQLKKEIALLKEELYEERIKFKNEKEKRFVNKVLSGEIEDSLSNKEIYEQNLDYNYDNDYNERGLNSSTREKEKNEKAKKRTGISITVEDVLKRAEEYYNSPINSNNMDKVDYERAFAEKSSNKSKLQKSQEDELYMELLGVKAEDILARFDTSKNSYDTLKSFETKNERPITKSALSYYKSLNSRNYDKNEIEQQETQNGIDTIAAKKRIISGIKTLQAETSLLPNEKVANIEKNVKEKDSDQESLIPNSLMNETVANSVASMDKAILNTKNEGNQIATNDIKNSNKQYKNTIGETHHQKFEDDDFDDFENVILEKDKSFELNNPKNVQDYNFNIEENNPEIIDENSTNNELNSLYSKDQYYALLANTNSLNSTDYKKQEAINNQEILSSQNLGNLLPKSRLNSAK